VVPVTVVAPVFARRGIDDTVTPRPRGIGECRFTASIYRSTPAASRPTKRATAAAKAGSAR